VEKNEVGGACGAYREERPIKGSLRKPEGKRPL
jgi:hypothetical protein